MFAIAASTEARKKDGIETNGSKVLIEKCVSHAAFVIPVKKSPPLVLFLGYADGGYLQPNMLHHTLLYYSFLLRLSEIRYNTRLIFGRRRFRSISTED